MSANRMAKRTSARQTQRGQILVMFVLAIFVVVGVLGLVLDGGSAYAQRRNEQNVADLSAMAGAYAYLNTQGSIAAKSAAADTSAQYIAGLNGFTQGQNGTNIAVSVNGGTYGADVQVNLTSNHRNNFAGALGMPTWSVSVTATANSTSRPNGAIGAMPLLFNVAAFPGAICDESGGTCNPEVYQLPGTGNQDVPQDATQFNWTVFCTANGGGSNGGYGQNGCNGNSNDVAAYMAGGGTSTTVYLSDDIGPWNGGTHADLFNDLLPNVGGAFPVPIVESDGTMAGWGYFRLVAVEGSPDKVIRGYFISPTNAEQLSVKTGNGEATLLTGGMDVSLTN